MINTEIHKETATTVGTGLIINYPLNVFLLFLFIDVFAWSNTFLIGTVVTGIITLVAYTRVYIIRNYFNNSRYQENDHYKKEHFYYWGVCITVLHPTSFWSRI